MDKLAEWKIKYPEQFNGLDGIISSFSEDEINKVCEFIYEYESTGLDPSTQYMLIPQNHTTYKLVGLDLFEEIYKIKCQNMVNGVMAEIESLDMLYGNESIPRRYYYDLKLEGVQKKFNVSG